MHIWLSMLINLLVPGVLLWNLTWPVNIKVKNGVLLVTLLIHIGFFCICFACGGHTLVLGFRHFARLWGSARLWHICTSFLQGLPTCFSDFTADLRLRMRKVWRDIADMTPQESDNILVTCHSWFACPLLICTRCHIQDKPAKMNAEFTSSMSTWGRYTSLRLDTVKIHDLDTNRGL